MTWVHGLLRKHWCPVDDLLPQAIHSAGSRVPRGLIGCSLHAMHIWLYRHATTRTQSRDGHRQKVKLHVHDETHMDRCSKGWTEVKTLNCAHNPEAECVGDRLVGRS